MPTRPLLAAAEISFLAYLHYLEDIAGVISGRYGSGVTGVYQTLQLHPPARALEGPPLAVSAAAALQGHLGQAWDALAVVDNAIDPAVYDRQSNAVLPGAGARAIAAAARALSVVLGGDVPAGDDDTFAFLGDLAEEELLPYPWSAFCVGCPQLGSAQWGGSVLPGDPVPVFAQPHPETSDARLAMLLRTTRHRVLERQFAVARVTDVRPGRTRRNLSAEVKEMIAAQAAPTTVFDVLDRVRRRGDDDDGLAFVEGAFDVEEAQRFATALAAVADAGVAAIEGVVANLIGWDVFAELAASHVRRTPGTASAAGRRCTAVAQVRSA